MKVWDCLIVGGGFAGLSAAIYLARFNRSAVILDKGPGRWNTHEINENYLGFPQGIPARKLRALGLEQALHFGAECVEDRIEQVECSEGHFHARGEAGWYVGRTIILATGVTDLFPEFENWKECLGRSLFWCITCDGWKTRGRRVLIVGRNDEAAETAMQFLNFTPHVTFVTNCLAPECELSTLWEQRLLDAGIPVYQSRLFRVESAEGMIETVELENERRLSIDFLFNQQGARPNTQLAAQLHVELATNGYIKTDAEQRTNISRVYAAGDVTKLFAHQIVTAAHEGSMAAQAANYDLYLPTQRLDS